MSELSQTEQCLKYFGRVPSGYEMMDYPVCCDCSHHWDCSYWKSIREDNQPL